LLKAGDLQSRLYMLVKILNREVQLADIKQSIQMRTREDIDRQQREYFLQQQIKNIQDELGAGQEDEIDELRQKGKPRNGVRKWQNSLKKKFPNWKGQIPNHRISMCNLPICKPC
jgi:ATP-dependent Lon protease, bacterial type